MENEVKSEFQKNRRIEIKMHWNIVVLEIAIYVTTILMFFWFGGRIEKLSTAQVSLVSIDGVIKLVAIICSLILVAIIFIPGPIYLMIDLWGYFEDRK